MSNICLKNNGKLSFDTKENSNIFKSYIAKFADNFFENLPPSPKIYGIDSLYSYYMKLNLESDEYSFSNISVETVLDLLLNVEPSKAAGIDDISGKFIRDGANDLALPITQLCNLSIKLSSFPSDCKIAKLKPIFKKGLKLAPKNFRPLSLLPLVSKIIEKLIHEQTEKYLSTYKILY